MWRLKLKILKPYDQQNLKTQHEATTTTTITISKYQTAKRSAKNASFLILILQTWTESALTISPLRRFASSSARRLLPVPVGPEITITFSFSFFIVPAAMEAVVRKRRRKARESGGTRKSVASGRRRHVRRLQTPPWIISELQPSAPCSKAQLKNTQYFEVQNKI